MRSFNAVTTMKQISANTKLCVGASNFTYHADEGALTFRVRVDNQRRFIKITLNALDLYDVEQILVRAGTMKTTFAAKDVYCENLDEVVYRLGSTRHADADWLKEVGIEKTS